MNPKKGKSSNASLIVIGEFSEIEGPRPVICFPNDKTAKFLDINTFIVNVLSSNCQNNLSSSENIFKLECDSENIWSDVNEGIYVYTSYFILNDIKARGNVRPFCINYITRNERWLQKNLLFVKDVISRVIYLWKYSNLWLYIHECEKRIIDYQYTREMYEHFLNCTSAPKSSEAKDNCSYSFLSQPGYAQQFSGVSSPGVYDSLITDTEATCNKIKSVLTDRSLNENLSRLELWRINADYSCTSEHIDQLIASTSTSELAAAVTSSDLEKTVNLTTFVPNEDASSEENELRSLARADSEISDNPSTSYPPIDTLTSTPNDEAGMNMAKKDAFEVLNSSKDDIAKTIDSAETHPDSPVVLLSPSVPPLTTGKSANFLEFTTNVDDVVASGELDSLKPSNHDDNIDAVETQLIDASASKRVNDSCSSDKGPQEDKLEGNSDDIEFGVEASSLDSNKSIKDLELPEANIVDEATNSTQVISGASSPVDAELEGVSNRKKLITHISRLYRYSHQPLLGRTDDSLTENSETRMTCATNESFKTLSMLEAQVEGDDQTLTIDELDGVVGGKVNALSSPSVSHKDSGVVLSQDEFKTSPPVVDASNINANKRITPPFLGSDGSQAKDNRSRQILANQIHETSSNQNSFNQVAPFGTPISSTSRHSSSSYSLSFSSSSTAATSSSTFSVKPGDVVLNPAFLIVAASGLSSSDRDST